MNTGKGTYRFQSTGMRFLEFAVWVSGALVALTLLAAL